MKNSKIPECFRLFNPYRALAMLRRDCGNNRTNEQWNIPLSCVPLFPLFRSLQTRVIPSGGNIGQKPIQIQHAPSRFIHQSGFQAGLPHDDELGCQWRSFYGSVRHPSNRDGNESAPSH